MLFENKLFTQLWTGGVDVIAMQPWRENASIHEAAHDLEVFLDLMGSKSVTAENWWQQAGGLKLDEKFPMVEMSLEERELRQAVREMVEKIEGLCRVKPKMKHTPGFKEVLNLAVKLGYFPPNSDLDNFGDPPSKDEISYSQGDSDDELDQLEDYTRRTP